MIGSCRRRPARPAGGISGCKGNGLAISDGAGVGRWKKQWGDRGNEPPLLSTTDESATAEAIISHMYS
ncbi:hypothetical protein EVAR_24501_1 [Eumeta japonica]|uniref:Uncharacterized protein n=1 Tax=Eumeta variegata TaxID=151549 RepID=A0A4C1US68_EUMVA|nr:hypothetical protein EVAR_24501_1 [Eumeta japonica]